MINMWPDTEKTIHIRDELGILITEDAASWIDKLIQERIRQYDTNTAEKVREGLGLK